MSQRIWWWNRVNYSAQFVHPGLVHFANFFNPVNSTTFVLFGKYCLIVDQLGSKNSSRDFQLNYLIHLVISNERAMIIVSYRTSINY